MSYVGAVIGVASVGASIYGASQAPDGVSTPDVRIRPLGVESTLGHLSIETLYELGVPYQGLEDELLQRKIEASGRKGQWPRRVMQEIQQLRGMLQFPELSRGGRSSDVDRLLRRINNVARVAGVGVSVGANGVEINFSGPEREMLEEIKAKEAQASKIKENRLKAMDQLNNILGKFSEDSSGQIPGEQDASKYLNTFLDEQYRTESDRLLAQANKLGISPGAQIGELQRALEVERTKIASGGALERALALAGGQQSILQKGLVPANAQTQLSFAGQASQDQLGAQALAQQLAIADAEAKSARAAGIANLGNSLVGAAGSVMSSQALGAALGKKDKE